MKKSYTYEEIESFLKKELSKTKHILTFGTIGSKNVERDLDVIITKKTNSSTVDFYKEIHILYDNLNSFLLKKYGARAIRFDSYEPEATKLAKITNKDLAIQTLVYGSFGQIKSHWDFSLFKDEKVEDILKNNYACIFGSINDLFSNKFTKETYADNMFIYLQMYDRINSGYEIKFLVKVMEKYLDYMYRKRMKLATPKIKNLEDIKKAWYNLCDEIDKLNEKKKNLKNIND